MYTVYKHTAPNGKVYIGITGQKPERRWRDGEGYKDQPYWYHAIRKYTWKNIKHENLYENLEKDQACDLEIKLISEYHATDPRYGYNISTGGECAGAGVHPSVETRRKLSEAVKRAYLNNPEYRLKLSESKKGKHLSAETRRKLSEANSGANSPLYGKHPSAAIRRKMSEARKGKPSPRKGAHLNAETRHKISEAQKGKTPWNKGTHLSTETRKKLSESLKGKTPWCKGKHLSAEHRRKLSESHKGNNSRSKAVVCIETGALYSSGTEAAKAIGVIQQAISNVLRGRQKTAGGYHWKYAEKEESK